MSAETVLRRLVDHDGPVGFDEFMDVALYDAGTGFFATSGRAGGHRGDFVTSPETGPLFGTLVGRYLDRVWRDLGEPDPFTFVDAGAGPGTLARTVLAEQPVCSSALHIVCVERSDEQRAQHPSGVDSRAEFPDEEITGVIFANELLDNLPFRLVERSHGEWTELLVRWDSPDQRFMFEPVALSPEQNSLVDALAPGAPAGARLPIQAHAAAWVRDALDCIGIGRLVAIDYTSISMVLARRPWTDWLRTYRAHERGTDPLADPGTQDITVEVAVDQLQAPTDMSTQADWLVDLGLAGLVDEGKRIWTERAGIGDLTALKARSRVSEAEALTDPAGLGAFQVLEWVVDDQPRAAP